ncbi:MAG: hypothetical protein FJ255_08765 [Phycisphaerae bacterium]|nr:hypothetical protein [Phycisphaerae bacterium]
MLTRSVAPALVALLLGAGCAEQNHRLNVGPIGGGAHVPALTARGGARATTIARADPRPTAHDEIAQRRWEETTLTLPVDGTWHGPLYGNTHRWSIDTPRRRGDYPTVESAAALDDPFGTVGETLATPFKALGDVALFVPRLIATPPTRQKRSPADEAYDRLPPSRVPARDGP